METNPSLSDDDKNWLRETTFGSGPGPVEFLVSRKIPDYREVRKTVKLTPHTLGFDGRPHQVRLAEIVAYEAELHGLPVRELRALYEAEQARLRDEFRHKAELEEKKLFFHAGNATADIAFWSKCAHWTLDEAIALSLSKEPRVVGWNNLSLLVGDRPLQSGTRTSANSQLGR